MTSLDKDRRKKQDISVVAEPRGDVIEAMMREGRKMIYAALASFDRAEDIEFTYGIAEVESYSIGGAPGLWKIEVTGTLHDVEIIEPSPYELLTGDLK